jgi:hypothetical protein
MVYIFVFLGEFGYELLNWQGVVRKFSSTLSSSEKIICCSRSYVAALYERAWVYIDLAQLPLFRDSVACAYFALHPADLNVLSWRNVWFDHRLKKQLVRFIRTQLPADREDVPFVKPRFVFSSDTVHLNGCTFGCHRKRYVMGSTEGTIYEFLPLGNNVFQSIRPDFSVQQEIERRLGWSLTEPFVLCQTRNRDIVRRSIDEVPKEALIEQLARRMRVVLLSFSTGRYLDSYSAFGEVPGCVLYHCPSFAHQTCLVHFARNCVFFTEGDFGSHIYVPPFLGKTVIAIAPRSVYQLGTTPIDFWNTRVFRFGGKIVPWVAEEIFRSPSVISQAVDELVS